MIECDVLVVGAGPAGSSAARASAKAGAKTIFIDKKKEIGVPVQCGESISNYLIPLLPFKIPKEQLIWKIDGMLFYAEDVAIKRTGKTWSGYAISRRSFDKWLANKAVGAGAKLLTSTELIRLEVKDEYNVTKAIVKTPRGDKEIKPKVLIAADGVESTVLKLLGLYKPKKGTFAEVYSWEMSNLNLNNPRLEQTFIGDFTPSGYAYIFPKSQNTANVGVGGLFPRKGLKAYFDEFLEISSVKNQVKNAKFVVEKSKKAPFRSLIDKWTYGDILLAGDVANQNFKPFIEGILPSVVCGNIAGRVAATAYNNGGIVENYENLVNKKLGYLFDKSNIITETIYDLFKINDNKKYSLILGISSSLISFRELVTLQNKLKVKKRTNKEI